MKRIDTSLAYILNAGTFFCCCVPLGVFGLYFAVQSSTAQRAGDLQAAATNARIATAIAAASVVVSMIVTIAQALATTSS